ncbi:MAG: DUF3667 domain-containing protein [Bacteroidota bacterium]
MAAHSDQQDSIDKDRGPTSEQATNLQRIDRRYFAQQLQQIFSIDRGLLYTTKEFFVRPGKAIQEFLYQNREKHVQPIVFLIFTSVVFSFLSYALDIQYNYFNISKIEGLKDHIDTGDFGKWLNSNVAYTNLLIGFFIALWIKVFARSYNIYEIIVALCFILGEATLVLSLAFVLGTITQSAYVVLGVMLIFFAYPIWAIGQFLGKKDWKSYFKALFVVILGYTSYVFIFILIAYLWTLMQQ